MTGENKENNEIKCNQCGQVIQDTSAYEEYLEVSKSWGYFSNKDLQTHTFHLCESCYDGLIEKFIIPIDIKKNNEAI
ncbi:MAG: hypothetical protein CVU84_16310 [Firmicutes bacterium HGW-Firmicutes-1]|jgi:ribosomal-protein-alanine N-acetyltransferase|nr:MAG: hypothetical protein CVU84_16310 [Firmicutes bacterium HGW-Firmicutes-1]